MATRNLTARFIAERDHYRSFGAGMDVGVRNDDGDDQESLLGGNASGPVSSAPPIWVGIVDEIEAHLKEIASGMANLATLHDKRLKVNFDDDDEEQDRKIDALASDITRLVRKAEAKLKKIASVGNTSANALSQEERTTRFNVMRSLGTKLSNQSKQFRQMQKDFLMRLQRRNATANKFFDDEDDSKRRSFEEGLDTGFTESQLMQLEEAKQSMDEREREIARIAQSINDLAMVFRELSVLVVEQGSVLDRIDYNIEQSMHTVKAGTAELIKAEEYQKRGKSLVCIIILIALIIICLLILIFRRRS
ncbi:t-SNARE coiled-coil homology domain-containing protein [Plasmodiophora brassicae]